MKNISRFRALALCASAFAALAIFTLPSIAQNVVQEDGTTIEFVGLKKWTVKQLQDSVRKHDPKGKLGFCAATLQSNLGFCDASVIWFAKDSLIITVVEPQDSAFVRRNLNFTELLFLPTSLYELQRKYAYKFSERSLVIAGQYLSDDSLRTLLAEHNKSSHPFARVDSTTFWEMRTILKNHNVSATRLAKIVTSSFDPTARGIAAMAMSQFADNDTCLAALIHALLDVAASTSILPAHECFNEILNHRTRPIVLKPIMADLQRLVNGTNLFAYWNVLKFINKAQPNEEEFKEIFVTDQARRLLYSHLAATSFYPRTVALRLLNTINPKFASLSEAEQKKYLNIR